MRFLGVFLLIVLTGLDICAQDPCHDLTWSTTTTSPSLLVVSQYSNGLSKYGFVDFSGKVKVPLTFDEAYSFSGDRALIKVNEKYGYIDQTGSVVIKPQFENACSFSEGLASVKLNGKYGYIDAEGTFKIPAQFDNAFNFSDGLARIKVYTKVDSNLDTVEAQFGYVDKQGKQVIPSIFDTASDFHNGIAKVVDSIFGLEVYINKDGKVIARKSNSPTEANALAPNLVEINIESSPTGANIYLIPKRRLELDSSLVNKSETDLTEFLVPSGATPTKFKAKQKRYIVLLVLNGTRKQIPLDVTPDGSNSVRVRF